ncbi:hypothetical protein PR202_ga17266 [Eleusine coracana subsp. coracana]|uniref:Peptidase A1 domain-containing protein n=1 Tax=Eleusine coracana subsp. coracana TaxID=191504 RepID=A0AAV5CPT9_ELECO|nr:hypothetical protein QOZ80_6AG0516290 [Eleusine coracana subsp. coracana]GJN00106.1 hypothetical protein PR202_ga17266 [Eleusine coracana subsp. coracana]
MGRILQLVVVLLVLVQAPLILSGPVRPRPKINRFSSQARPMKFILRSVVKGAGRWIKDQIMSPSRGRQEDEPDNSADSAGFFIFNLSIGTSTPQEIPGILDITSQLVWSQCKPCTTCIPAATFEPNRSATFSRLPCSSQTCQSVVNQTCAAKDGPCGYIATYGDATTNTTGYLSNDTFTFDSAQVPLVFGCSGASAGDFSGASGVFGFSRGPLSLVSQLQLSWFSYFWASDDSSGDSFVQFGDDEVPRTSNSRSTPVLTNPLYPDLYFVNLTGIKIDGELQRDIPAGTFDLRANGSGGVVLSTTVPATFLEEAAYDVVKKVLSSKIKPKPVNGSALGLDLCYTIQSIASLTLPKIALVFDGADAVMHLKRSNYFFRDNETGLDCLTILPNRGLSLLGSLVQTDRNITYDIADAQAPQLVFDDAGAAPPVHSLASLSMALSFTVWMVVLF